MDFGKTLTSLEKNYLLAYFDYDNIYDAKKKLNIKKAEQAYKKMIKMYEKEKKEEMIKESMKRAKKEAEQVLILIKKKKQTKQNKERKYYKKNVMEFDYRKQENWIGSLYELLRNYEGKSIHIEVVDKNTNQSLLSNDTEINKLSDWWKSTGRYLLEYPEPYFIDYGNNIILYIYEANKVINPTKIQQYFKEGQTNCLLTPILNWANNCLEDSKSSSSKKRYNSIINKVNKYMIQVQDSGVNEEMIEKIANDIQVDITIEKPLCDVKFIETKANKKSLKHFKYINTRLNHVDNFVYENKYIEVSRKELLNMKKDLDEKGEHYVFKTDLINVNSITTLEGTYKLSSKFRDICNQFEIDTGLVNCKIDDIDDYILSQFVKRGTHYNSTIDFSEDRNNIKHADMEGAYTQYKQCSVYEGFLGKITDLRPTNKIEGVGLYLINKIVFPEGLFKQYNNKMRIFINYNVYTSAELRFLSNNGVTYNILMGCWGVKPLDFDMREYDGLMKKYDGIKGYAKYVGSCDSHRLKKKYYINGDEEYAGELKLNTTGEIKYFYGKNMIEISYDKKHNYHLGHFTAFITAYQRLNVLEQLLKMDINDIVRVCVDGIYYRGDYELCNSFRSKTDRNFGNAPDTKYISNLYKKFDLEIESEYREHNTKELHIGQGGNGKTHMNLVDKGLMKVLYIAPSWKLSTKKAIEYNVKSNVLANVLSTDPEKINLIKSNNVLLLDEVSMMEEHQKEYIFDTYSDMKLIFCGDVGFQAPPFRIDCLPAIQIKQIGFDKIIEHTENYRFKCDKLKMIIDELRVLIRFNAANKSVNEYVIEQIGTIKDEEMNYSVNDMILTRSHNIKDKYTEKYKNMNKWYVTKNTREYKNGEIIIGDKPETTCELRHAYTIHSIQGETANHKLFINMDIVYDKRILYTAISRARRLDQIILIKN